MPYYGSAGWLTVSCCCAVGACDLGGQGGVGRDNQQKITFSHKHTHQICFCCTSDWFDRASEGRIDIAKHAPGSLSTCDRGAPFCFLAAKQRQHRCHARSYATCTNFRLVGLLAPS
ncbi:unnamed protein product, partial [Ectocarpus sp. 8 AP-2014]